MHDSDRYDASTTAAPSRPHARDWVNDGTMHRTVVIDERVFLGFGAYREEIEALLRD